MTRRRVVHPLPRIEEMSLRAVREERATALFTSGPAWDALGGALELPVVWRAEPAEATADRFAAWAAAIPAEAKVVWAVGGGLAVDAAKVAARDRRLPLVCAPTALSVDAFLTPASGVRRDGCVVYLDTGPPERLVVDWEVLAAAPPFVRAAGIGDLLSIATGLWDWRYAEERGSNPPGMARVGYAADLAQVLLDEAMAIAAAAGRGEVAGLRRLLDLLALEVQLCNLLGHSRPEEGSEHAFAYLVENRVGKGLPHGDLVGPGILAIAAAQGQEAARLREALAASGARLDRIPRPDAEATLRELPAFARRHGLPHSIAHDLDEERVAAALAAVWG